MNKRERGALLPTLGSTEYMLLAGTAKLIAAICTYPHEVRDCERVGRVERKKRKGEQEEKEGRKWLGRRMTLIITQVLRTRMREQRAVVLGQKPKYTGLQQALRLIFKEEGVAGLYGGMTTHLMRVVPNAAIMFWTYELVVRQLSPE
jgi:hypothetical protein